MFHPYYCIRGCERGKAGNPPSIPMSNSGSYSPLALSLSEVIAIAQTLLPCHQGRSKKKRLHSDMLWSKKLRLRRYPWFKKFSLPRY